MLLNLRFHADSNPRSAHQPPREMARVLLRLLLRARSTIKRLMLPPSRAAARSICSFSWSLIRMSIPLFLPVLLRRALETPGSIFRFFLVTAFPFCILSMGRNSNPVRHKYYAPKKYIHGRTHPISQPNQEANPRTPKLPSVHLKNNSARCRTLATTKRRLGFLYWP